MDNTAIRLKCLEIATSEHPGTRLMRAQELFEWVTGAKTASASADNGSRSESSDVKPAEAADGHYVIRAGNWEAES